MSEPKNTLEMIHCWFDVVIDVIWFWHTHMAGYLLLVLVASLQDWKLTVPICWEAKLSVFRIPIWCSKSLKEIHTGIGIGGSGREGCVTFSLSISLKPAILPWVFRPSYSIEPVSSHLTQWSQRGSPRILPMHLWAVICWSNFHAMVGKNQVHEWIRKYHKDTRLQETSWNPLTILHE